MADEFTMISIPTSLYKSIVEKIGKDAEEAVSKYIENILKENIFVW